ncbi:gluconeogenesis factor YvcK family protein [Pseudalkalibacillus salsuginis]|uniref:gluconeogenesis factor YvcK family protein n=1 Tax=Pseudalkalibacillus salsuginis TaxID=2910972 RepID=UPI001F46556C|nr:YvcK family protein [Pseudalkalibacillus salsuginis]MCF6410239.1 YvcK family protein [Pseudalkalibacillus salsuginis]
MNRRPKVVVFGGGTGLSVLLRGLKKFPVDITAIVTVADDGGSSGRLREELDIIPPGDIRNVLAALSEVEPLVEQLFQHRFTNGNGLSGHSLGNLLLAAMSDITGNFVTGIRELSKVLNVRGKVLPASDHRVILNAQMNDGSIVSGESKIPHTGKQIVRVFLTPDTVKPLDESLRAIRDADLILIGPGSLYTSILPSLLVPGIPEEIKNSTARKVYICNVMTQPGETDYFTASDHVNKLVSHIGQQIIDTIIVNNDKVPDNVLTKYEAEGGEPVEYDEKRLKSFGFKVISDKIVQYNDSLIRHDAKRVSEIILDLVSDY